MQSDEDLCVNVLIEIADHGVTSPSISLIKEHWKVSVLKNRSLIDFARKTIKYKDFRTKNIPQIFTVLYWLTFSLLFLFSVRYRFSRLKNLKKDYVLRIISQFRPYLTPCYLVTTSSVKSSLRWAHLIELKLVFISIWFCKNNFPPY